MCAQNVLESIEYLLRGSRGAVARGLGVPPTAQLSRDTLDIYTFHRPQADLERPVVQLRQQGCGMGALDTLEDVDSPIQVLPDSARLSQDLP